MPTRLLEGGVPVVEFDLLVEVSPYQLFRRLKESENPPLLVDVRTAPARATLRGAVALSPQWAPPENRDVVLFDDEGSTAVVLARQFQQAGHPRVRALFGGLDLYGFALDPQVVGVETFLVAMD
jgi:hypothetical protein